MRAILSTLLAGSILAACVGDGLASLPGTPIPLAGPADGTLLTPDAPAWFSWEVAMLPDAPDEPAWTEFRLTARLVGSDKEMTWPADGTWQPLATLPTTTDKIWHDITTHTVYLELETTDFGTPGSWQWMVRGRNADQDAHLVRTSPERGLHVEIPDEPVVDLTLAISSVSPASAGPTHAPGETIDITWDAVADATGYQIAIDEDPAAGAEAWRTFSPTTEHGAGVRDTHVTLPMAAYGSIRFAVRAIHDSGQGGTAQVGIPAVTDEFLVEGLHEGFSLGSPPATVTTVPELRHLSCNYTNCLIVTATGDVWMSEETPLLLPAGAVWTDITAGVNAGARTPTSAFRLGSTGDPVVIGRAGLARFLNSGAIPPAWDTWDPGISTTLSDLHASLGTASSDLDGGICVGDYCVLALPGSIYRHDGIEGYWQPMSPAISSSVTSLGTDGTFRLIATLADGSIVMGDMEEGVSMVDTSMVGMVDSAAFARIEGFGVLTLMVTGSPGAAPAASMIRTTISDTAFGWSLPGTWVIPASAPDERVIHVGYAQAPWTAVGASGTIRVSDDAFETVSSGDTQVPSRAIRPPNDGSFLLAAPIGASGAGTSFSGFVMIGEGGRIAIWLKDIGG